MAKVLEMMIYLASRKGQDVPLDGLMRVCGGDYAFCTHHLRHQVAMSRVYNRGEEIYRISPEGIEWVEQQKKK